MEEKIRKILCEREKCKSLDFIGIWEALGRKFWLFNIMDKNHEKFGSTISFREK